MKRTTLFSLVILILIAMQSCTLEEDTTNKTELKSLNAQQIEYSEVDPGKVKPPTGG
jgi:hypothetical protein